MSKCNCDLCRCETKEDYFNNMCNELRKAIFDKEIPKGITLLEYVKQVVESGLEFIAEVKNGTN